MKSLLLFLTCVVSFSTSVTFAQKAHVVLQSKSYYKDDIANAELAQPYFDFKANNKNKIQKDIDKKIDAGKPFLTGYDIKSITPVDEATLKAYQAKFPELTRAYIYRMKGKDRSFTTVYGNLAEWSLLYELESNDNGMRREVHLLSYSVDKE